MYTMILATKNVQGVKTLKFPLVNTFLLQGNETFYSCFSNQKGDEYRYTEIKRQCNSNAASQGLVSDSATAAASKESVRNIVVDILSQMQSNEKSEYNNTKK